MLHANDKGYVDFYNDVNQEIEKIRSSYNISDSDSSEFILEKFEFWLEEDFFYPEVDDGVLFQHSARRILTVFESSELNSCK